MPRIDPLQLLECLSVLLATNGGIKSTQEVKRIASLMQKFSKKLVSKCIYIQILKCSETDLLGQFMETGGWTMTHNWLEDAIATDNWPLVQEILELFLLCPVDVTRLRSNSAPKLVKTLSKEAKHERVKILSARLVEQWLKLVKGEAIALPPTNQMGVDASVPRLIAGYQQQQQQQHHNQIQLLDPSHPSYADTLAIVGDELGGLGSLGSADIDVDEIIPTLSHNHHQQHSSHHILDDGVVVEEQQQQEGGQQFIASTTHGSEDVLMEEVDSSITTRGHTNNSSSSSHDKNVITSNSSSHSNNNVTEGGEKDDLKIKIITMKDGKTKVASSSSSSSNRDEEKTKSSSSSSSRSERKSSSDKERSKSSGGDRKSSGSTSKSSSSSTSGHKSSSSSSSSTKRSSGKSSSSSSSSSRDKERSEKDRDRSSSHKSSSSSSKSTSSSSGSSSRAKEVSVSQADKDKDTLTKVMGATSTLDKLGKIPKKPKASSSEEATATVSNAAAVPVKKPSSFSIEGRKDPENRPKTVKTFNSQFRNHGLVDDIPPPPSRKTLKKPESTTTAAPSAIATTNKSSTNTLKRPSPTKEEATTTTAAESAVPSSPISEKRMKLDQIVAASTAAADEKPGGVKLIAPRSKPTLIESDMFMDALCSSAPKGVAKKRKRLANSNSKDGSPPHTPDSPKIVAAPMKFYQDTLEDKDTSAAGQNASTTEGDESSEGSPSKKAATSNNDEDSFTTPASPNANPASPSPSGGSPKPAGDGPASGDEDNKDNIVTAAADEEMDVEEDTTPKPPGPGCGPNGPPGVLVIHRRKAPKKTLRWRPQESLEEIRLFELDETERVNVTKTFMDAKQNERFGERDAFNVGRKLHGTDDVMVEQTPWTHRIEVDDVPVTAMGGQSKERDVQAARELTCLQALYFSFAMIPDSSTEPEAETYKYAEPAVMPLEDAQNTVNDFTKQGWPEPKEANGNPMFNGGVGNGMMGGVGPFESPFGPFNNNLAFSGNPGIWAAGGGGPPPFGVPPMNGMNVPPFVGNMNSEEMKAAMNRLAFPGQQFNPPNFNGINMMNLPAMGAGGPMGPGGPGGPPGPWGFRGAPPMGGGGGWRGLGPQQQQQQQLQNGGGPRREWTNNINNNNGGGGRPCKNFKKGFCKKGDRCNFMH